MVTNYTQASNLGAGFELYSYPLSNGYGVRLNTGRGATANEKFRQALNYAVDRDGISTSLTSGQCVPNGQALTPGADGHLDNSTTEFTYDPDRARRLIAESGVADPELTFIVPNGLSLQEDIATAVQSQLAEVGVGVTIEKADPIEMNTRYATGVADGIVNPTVPQATSLQTLDRNYTNSRSFPGPTPEGLEPLLERLYNPGISKDERLDLLTNASTLVTEQAAGLFICSTPTQFAHSDKVVGIENMGVSNFQGIFDTRSVGIGE